MLDAINSSNSSEQGKAISMISYDLNKRRFVLNPEIEEMIMPLSAPLGVISVAGMYRTGKSYLLNRMLLNQNKGFSVGPSINPCTKGLWMWSKTIQAHTPEGKPIDVLIIDTEGIGATDEDNNHDNKIMTLAILLSSYFLYNSLGTIDENSIQNLSFIVNITKKIQEKNKEKNDLDFVKNLPSFMWVIRDFILQLKNRDGYPITSKDYLEKSLEFQSGNSEFIKNKNEIRKMVKEFFPRRDCVTLVRPLTEEGHLQNLETMDDSKLRREFIDQINYLRKTVLNSITPKVINGKELNGEMLLNVMKCYVDMINKGAVPVIQTAWTFMLQTQLETAKKNGILEYKTKLLDIERKLPMQQQSLKYELMDLKQSIIAMYTETIIGEPEKEEIEKLSKELDKCSLEILVKNDTVSKEITEKFISENAGKIKNTVREYGYKNLNEYKEDVENFINFTLNKCPAGPQREVCLYKFLKEALLEDIQFFEAEQREELSKLLAKANEELESQRSLQNEESTQSLQLKKDYETLELKLRQISGEKEDMNNESNNEKENMNKLMQEKNEEFLVLKKRLSDVEKEGETKIIEIKKKYEIIQRETHSSDLESTEKSSNCGKERILLEQKVKFMEKCLKDLEEQNKGLLLSHRAPKEGDVSEKELKEKFEAEIKSLSKKVKELQEQGIELDSQLLIKSKKIENEKANATEIIETYQKKLEELQENNLEMNKNINRFKENSSAKLDALINDYESKLEILDKEESDVLDKEKSEEDSLKKQVVKVSAEYAVSVQEKEIAEKKILQLKEQNQSEKMEHDKYIKILEENNKELLEKYESSTENNNRLKANNSSQLTKVQSENDKKEEEIKGKNTLLNSNLSELIRENDEKIRALKKKVKDTENVIIPELKKQISDLRQQKITMDKNYEDNLKDQKHKLEEISLSYEAQKEKILTSNREQLESDNNENDRQIQEIRKIFQLEKDKIFKEIQEENEEAAKSLNLLEEEQNEKLTQLEREKDDKIAELQETLDEVTNAHEEYVKKIDRELLLRNQKIESLQKFIEDNKTSINNIKLQQENYLKELLEEFEKDKEILNEKIRKATKDQEETEIEYKALVEQNKSIENSGDNLKGEVEKLRNIIQETRSENEEKLSELKTKLSELKQEESIEKLTQEKELSLKEQSISFLSKKLEELKDELGRTRSEFEEKLDKEKEKIIKEFEEKISKVSEEKESVERELSDLEKNFVDLQMKYNTQTESLSKEKEKYLEELNDLLQKKKTFSEDLENNHTAEKTAQTKIKTELKNKNDNLQKLNLELQKKLQKLENEYNNLMSTYDNEKSYFDSKFSFMQDQKIQLEKELNDLKVKYDSNMDELQQKILAERERLEAIYKKSLVDGENIHNQQLKQAQDTFNKKYEEVNIQNNNLISENSILEKKIEEYQNDSHVSDVDIRLQDALEEEKKLKSEIENVTCGKEEIIENLKQKLKQESILQKQKIEELSQKLQEYDDKTKHNNASLLKDKAVNEKDSENKILVIQQLNEQLQNLKAENEKLTLLNKEAQKEYESYRKTSRGGSRHTTTGLAKLTYIPKRKHISIISNSNKENVTGNLSSYSGNSVILYGENMEDKKTTEAQMQEENNFRNLKSKSQIS